jgi:hypothetical protein
MQCGIDPGNLQPKKAFLGLVEFNDDGNNMSCANQQ